MNLLTARRFRVVAVTIVTMLLVFLLYSSNSNVQKTNNQVAKEEVLPEKFQTSNNILHSNNDDKVDEAINQEISKNEKEVTKPIVNQDDAILQDEPFDPVEELIQIRSLGPMIVFSKTHCPYSLKIKKLLLNYQITPEPQFVELDKHQHGRELQSYLKEVTGRGTVPNVLVGKSSDSRGGADDFIALDRDNELVAQLKAWGENSLDVKKLNTPSNY